MARDATTAVKDNVCKVFISTPSSPQHCFESAMCCLSVIVSWMLDDSYRVLLFFSMISICQSKVSGSQIPGRPGNRFSPQWRQKQYQMTMPPQQQCSSGSAVYTIFIFLNQKRCPFVDYTISCFFYRSVVFLGPHPDQPKVVTLWLVTYGSWVINGNLQCYKVRSLHTALLALLYRIT